MSPKRYIEKCLTSSYLRIFGEAPSTRYHAPLEHGDHHELDTPELLDQDGIDQYQSLIGSLQWLLTLGRFDIQVAVMSLSSF